MGFRILPFASLILSLSSLLAQAQPNYCNNYVLHERLISPAAVPEGFPTAIDINGEHIVIGDAKHDGFRGEAYCYNANTGNLVATFADPDLPETDDSFGFSVASYGNIVVIGSPFDEPTTALTQNPGSAFVYSLLTGSLQAAIENPRPGSTTEPGFGYSVSASAGLVAVGAPFYSAPGGIRCGAVYVFTPGGGLLRTIDNPLAATDPMSAAFDEFGYSVSLQGELLAVGAPTGSTFHAYLFNASTGQVLHEFFPPVPQVVLAFGEHISLSSANLLAVGSFNGITIFNTITGGWIRAAWNLDGQCELLGERMLLRTNPVGLFNAITGTLITQFPAPPGAINFGFPVAIGSQFVSIGSGLDDAYVFACTDPSPTPSPSATATATPTPTVTPPPSSTPPKASATSTPTQSPMPLCCMGDADNSGSFVDAGDFIAVQANFGADNGVGGLGDANCSGSFVDAGDFIAVQANFGADCG